MFTHKFYYADGTIERHHVEPTGMPTWKLIKALEPINNPFDPDAVFHPGEWAALECCTFELAPGGDYWEIAPDIYRPSHASD